VLSTQRFAIDDNAIDMGIHFQTKFKNFLTIDRDQTLLNHTIGFATTGDAAIGNQFVKSGKR